MKSGGRNCHRPLTAFIILLSEALKLVALFRKDHRRGERLGLVEVHQRIGDDNYRISDHHLARQTMTDRREFVVVWVKSESHSLASDPLRPSGLYSPWNSPGQNTGVGSLSLLQRIFLTQESNQGLLSYPN